ASKADRTATPATGAAAPTATRAAATTADSAAATTAAPVSEEGAELRRTGSATVSKTVISIAGVQACDMQIGPPRTIRGPSPVSMENMSCASRPHSLRGARRSPRCGQSDKLIRACSVDPPVKHTVVRVLGVNAWLLVEDLPHDGSPCPCRRSLAPAPSPG